MLVEKPCRSADPWWQLAVPPQASHLTFSKSFCDWKGQGWEREEAKGAHGSGGPVQQLRLPSLSPGRRWPAAKGAVPLRSSLYSDFHATVCEGASTCFLKTGFLKLGSKSNSLIWNSDEKSEEVAEAAKGGAQAVVVDCWVCWDPADLTQHPERHRGPP